MTGRHHLVGGDRGTHLRQSVPHSTSYDPPNALQLSAVVGLQAALDAKQATSAKGSANGYASLGSDGFVPTAQTNTALPLWVKYVKTYTDFSAAALTKDIELFQLPAKGVIHGVFINPTVAFTGGLIASFSLSVGNAGLLTKYSTAVSVFTASLQAPQALMGVESMSIATSIRVAAISTVGTLDAATAGSADVYVLRSTLP